MVVTIGSDSATLSGLVSIVSVLLSAAIGLYAVIVATRQSRTAEERLRLDFFERRFKVWEATSAAIELRYKYVLSMTADECNIASYKNIGLVEFREVERQARFLFGPEVFKQYAQIRGALTHLQVSHVTLLTSDFGERGALRQQAQLFIQKAFNDALQAGEGEHQVLMQLVAPYLALGEIAKLRPNRWAARRANLGAWWRLRVAPLVSTMGKPFKRR
jgi:hypothetical protein